MKELPIQRAGSFYYFLKTEDPFITYEESDIPYLKYAGKVKREAGRGEGRSEKLLQDILEYHKTEKLILHVSASLHTAENFCKRFSYLKQENYQRSSCYEVKDLSTRNKVIFLSRTSSLRGFNNYSVYFDHDWSWEANHTLTARNQCNEVRQMLVFKANNRNEYYDSRS